MKVEGNERHFVENKEVERDFNAFFVEKSEHQAHARVRKGHGAVESEVGDEKEIDVGLVGMRAAYACLQFNL